jgi:nucleolin
MRPQKQKTNQKQSHSSTTVMVMGDKIMDESSKKSRRKRSKGSSVITTSDGGEDVGIAPEAASQDHVEENADDGASTDGGDDSKKCVGGESNDPPNDEHDNKEEEDGVDESTNNQEEDTTKRKKRKRTRKKKSTTEDGPDNKVVTTQQQQQQLANSVEHTVFIEGLPFTSTESDVRFFFTTHECHDIVQLRLPTWQDTGRLRGFGHVVFASPETRLRALSDEVNGKELGGRYITIKEANAPRAGTTAGAALGVGGGKAPRAQPGGCKTVFVRNLPYDASEDEIRESFRTFGKILEDGVRVVRNHANGQSKGFGYVEFKNEEGALAAVQKASKPFGLTVLNRPVFVDYDEGAMKGSFRDKEGKLWSKEHTSKSSGGGGFGAGKPGRGGGRGGGPGFGMRGGR